MTTESGAARSLLELSVAIASDAFTQFSAAAEGMVEEDLEDAMDYISKELDASRGSDRERVVWAADWLYSQWWMANRNQDDIVTAWDGYECLDDLRPEEARQVAMRLLDKADSEVDDWIRANDSYHAHMILSGVNLANDDIDRAVGELHAAAEFSSGPTFDSTFDHLLRLVRSGRGKDVLLFLDVLATRFGEEDSRNQSKT